MESAQTLTSGANQENVTSNNALSVNDSSTRGFCLQRKSAVMHVSPSNNVMQKKAWVITRHLALGNIPFSDKILPYSLNNEENAGTKWYMRIKRWKKIPFLGSSFHSNGSTKSGITDSNDSLGGSSGIGGSSASSAGSSSSSTNAEKYGSERYHDLFDDNGNVKEGIYSGKEYYLTKQQLAVNTKHLQTHHRHILFDKPHNLKFGNHIASSDNIGYGAGNTEENKGLYSESDLKLYAVRNPISKNPIEDECLVKAINSEEAQDFGKTPYNLPTHNCQHWVNLVFHKFLEIARALAKKTMKRKKKIDDATSSVADESSQGESIQRKASLAGGSVQRVSVSPCSNNTGLPDNLKSGVEALSGYSLDNVRVHYNSSKPAAVQACAYTQGTDIHIAPGQERCLPHEAWHVTQQMSGRVTPTTSIGGIAVNDDDALEREADVMGARAML